MDLTITHYFLGMMPMDNKNFKSVSLYEPTLTLKYINSCIKTDHINEQRKKRYLLINKYNQNAKIDRTFLVDKGHPNGPELHSVSKNAVIFIINASTRKFITVLFARPNQVRRLYEECGLELPKNIHNRAMYYIQNGINHL